MQAIAAVEGEGLPEIRHMPMAADEAAAGDHWLAGPLPDDASRRRADNDAGEVVSESRDERRLMASALTAAQFKRENGVRAVTNER